MISKSRGKIGRGCAAEPIRFQSLLTSAINICDARFIGDADLQTRALIPRRKAISVRDQPPRIGIALDSRRDDRSPSGASYRALRFRAALGADVSDVIELPGDRRDGFGIHRLSAPGTKDDGQAVRR